MGLVVMETLIKIELVPNHKADLIKKTKNFIYYWYNRISRLEYKIMVDEFTKHAGKNIKVWNPMDFDSFVDSIFKKCPAQYIDRSTVEKECISYLDRIAMGGIEFEQSIEKELLSLLRRIEEIIGEWHVIIPIDNLTLKDLEELKIGTVNLYNFSKIKEVIENDIENIYWDQAKEIFFKDTEGKIWAKVVVIKEEGKQYQEVLARIDSTINLLRIYLYLIHPSYFKLAKIGISEGFLSSRKMLSYKRDTNSIGAHLENIRFNMPFVLARKDIEQLYQQYPLSKIDSILCIDELSRSDIENRLFTAIRWIGAGIHEDRSCDKFLNYAIALECMLGKKDESIAITESLAERCAFLLDNDDSASRYAIYKSVQYLYGIRSEIVHGGKTNIDDESVKIFETIALRSFFQIVILTIDSNLKDMKELVIWIDRKKMGLYYSESAV